MKYEINYAKNSIMKTFIVLIFYIFVLILSMYLFCLKTHEETELENQILKFLTYPIMKEYSYFDILLYIFGNLYFVLYFTFYYIYEYLCFHNNLATRYKAKIWVSHKYLIGTILIIMISLIQYGCVYSIFTSTLPLSMKYYIYPIIYKMFIMSSVYTLFNMYKTNKLLFFFIAIFLTYILFHFNFFIFLILILFSFVLNYLFFDLKQFSYNFN